MLSITANHKAIHDDWQKVLDSGVFTEGPFVRKLEDEVSKLYGMPAIAFNSAGTALFSVMRGLNIKGKGAYVPVNTFFATGAMTVEAGVSPVLVDAHPQTFCMDPMHMQRLHENLPIKTHVRAVVHTPVGGHLFRDKHEEVATWATGQGLKFVDDAAHGLGIGFGQFGKHGPAVFSLYPTKAVPGGEGGVVITKDENLAMFLRDFRNYGKYKLEDGVMRYEQGFNFRMDEWTAVVAYHQLLALPEILRRRQVVADKLKQIVQPLMASYETNWYRYIVSADFPAKKQVGKVYARTDQLDWALGLRRSEEDDKRFPQAKAIAESHICLPLHEKMWSWTVASIERYLTTDWEPLH